MWSQITPTMYAMEHDGFYGTVRVCGNRWRWDVSLHFGGKSLQLLEAGFSKSRALAYRMVERRIARRVKEAAQ